MHVAHKAVDIAKRHPELQLDETFLYDASLLHDIGIIRCAAPEICCYGTEPYLRHGVCGAEMLLNDGWDKVFPETLVHRWARVCMRHTGAGLTKDDIVSHQLPLPAVDLLPETLEEQAVCYADKFFSKTVLDAEKDLSRVRQSMLRYSADSLRRFEAMHALFG